MASFLPSHQRIAAPGADPARWMFVLHGILGSGANFRSFARRLAAACPEWGFVLVDLRMHGQSQGAPPPHTIAAAADDLVRLEAEIALPITGVMGHSFGGKVALAYTPRAPRELDQVWVLDASPGARRERAATTEAVLRTLRAMPALLPSRASFLDAVTRDGHPRAVAEWLAMNGKPADGGFRVRLDLDAIQALLDSYVTTDLWPVVERPEGTRAIHVVIAGRSDALDGGDQSRLAAIAAVEPRVHTHVIEEAGHWVHVDAPDALFELVRQSISTTTGA